MARKQGSPRNRSQPAASARPLLLRFVGLFFVYVLLANAFLLLPSFQDKVIQPWTEANATLASQLCTLLTMDTTVNGVHVRSGSAFLEILPGCNGIHALILFAAAVLAFPAPWLWRLVGLLAGTAALFLLNLLRLVNLIAVARYWPDHLEFFHVYVWQMLIVLLALLLFVAWQKTANKSIHGLP